MTMKRVLAGAALLALLSGGLFAQSPATPPADPVSAAPAGPPPTFEIADVHASPHVNQAFMRGGDLHGDRFLVRQASMVDLIAKAYGVENDNVLRGPAWLDIDRFDVMAKAPRTTSADDVKLMLRALLADRFKLVVHADTKPLPAFLLTVGKGGTKMKEADGTGDPGCQYKPPPQNPAPGSPPPYIAFSCHSVTMTEFAQDLHNWAGGYLTNPVVDATGLKGAWDFDFKWTGKGDLQRAGADGISIFDCVDKQLGLKLEAKTAPLPVVLVDSANEKPTANPPGLDKALPPPPPAEFDVAIIKPSPPDTRGINGRINGGQVNLTGATVRWMIAWAWDLNDDMIADAPKWLNQDRYDLLAKVAVDPQATGPKGAPQIEMDDLQQMVKALLAERFKLASHMEDRPADAYTLFAANPKLKKADPENRTGCKEGPGPDGKDPRIANPILGRLLTCSNMTLAQFGAQLQTLANGYIHVPVLDATGLTDAYDFTLSFSTAGQIRSPPPPAAGGDPNAAAAAAADPTGGLSLFDAIEKQMGLKLEKQKRPVPMLVIDHIEEKPTDN